MRVGIDLRRDGGSGGGGARVRAAERRVPRRVHVGPQLRVVVPPGGLGRRQVRRALPQVQVHQEVLASYLSCSYPQAIAIASRMWPRSVHSRDVCGCVPPYRVRLYGPEATSTDGLGVSSTRIIKSAVNNVYVVQINRAAIVQQLTVPAMILCVLTCVHYLLISSPSRSVDACECMYEKIFPTLVGS